MAVYIVAVILVLGTAGGAAITIFSFRRKKMEEAYREYDELAAEGLRPCIVMSSIFGPTVIINYPSHMRTNLMCWVENGKRRMYDTTTQERLDQTLGLG